LQILAVCTFILLAETNKSHKKGAKLTSMTFSDCPSSPDRDEIISEQDVFQLLFLNTENQTVEAWETNSIELDDLIDHLRAGESVFINPKKHNREDLLRRLDKKMKDPAYFKRI
jgi:hypothetical protein